MTTADGTRLRVSDRGSGPPIVLVHGWKMSHRVWDHAVLRLAARHRVVAFDLRGMGESDKPEDVSFAALARDLGELVERLELTDATVVGWSMGCTVCLEYLRRGGTGIGRLVLVNGPIRLTATEDFPHTMSDAALDAYIADLRESWPRRERGFTRDGFRSPDPELVDWICGIALQTSLETALALVTEQRTLDFRDTLPRIGCPTLAVYGAHDPYYPTALAHYIADRVPGGRAHVMEGSAHYPFIEEPDAFALLVSEFTNLIKDKIGP